MPVDYDPSNTKRVIPAGEYDAELIGVEDCRSRAGNAMQKWTLRVDAGDGGLVTVWDYMLPAKSLYKLEQLAKALGKGDEFKARQFQADENIHAIFRVALEVENHPEFGDKNVVKKYLPAAAPVAGQVEDAAPAVSDASAPAPEPGPAGQPVRVSEDEIPF
jgi:hypothetical protein